MAVGVVQKRDPPDDKQIPTMLQFPLQHSVLFTHVDPNLRQTAQGSPMGCIHLSVMASQQQPLA